MTKMTLEKFFFEIPLYEILKWTEDDASIIMDIIYFDSRVDGPCISCGKDTTYKQKTVVPLVKEGYKRTILEFIYKVSLCCSRDEAHQIDYFIKVSPSLQEYQKIGQFPSIASLTKGELSKYRKILGDKFNEFSRGIGLVSHGVGIGAFIYLRRVFEYLIEQSHQQAIDSAGWEEETYVKSRMDGKIELLRFILPTFLVKNKALYGILSKGVHELSEQECLEIFPAVKFGIELVLDERIKQKEQEDQIKQGEKLIREVTSKLRSRN